MKRLPFDEEAAAVVVRRLTAEGKTEAQVARGINRSRYFLSSLRLRHSLPKARPMREHPVEVHTSIGVPQTSRSEAVGLLPLLRRKSETVSSLRQLIDISAEEAASLSREIGPLASSFVSYRKKVLAEWNQLVKARGIPE